MKGAIKYAALGAEISRIGPDDAYMFCGGVADGGFHSTPLSSSSYCIDMDFHCADVALHWETHLIQRLYSKQLSVVEYSIYIFFIYI